MMDYKGYKAQIDFDGDAGIFVGQVINMRDGLTFSGHSVDELTTAFHQAVEEYIALSRDAGGKSDPPCSGKICIRVNPTLHQAIASSAQREGKSIAAWTADRLSEAVGISRSPRTSDPSL